MAMIENISKAICSNCEQVSVAALYRTGNDMEERIKKGHLMKINKEFIEKIEKDLLTNPGLKSNIDVLIKKIDPSN